jgi:hypothetical protein
VIGNQSHQALAAPSTNSSGMSKRKKKKRTLHLPYENEPVDDKGWFLAPLLDQDQ